MVLRDELCRFLNEYLEIEYIDDYGYNGLQVTGAEEITRVAFAVDAGLEVFQRCKELNAQMLIVHHGIFWKKADPRIIGVHGKRISYLLENDINLYGVHLPLDMHDEVGNNCEIIRLLGADITDRMGRHGKGFVGAIGTLDQPRSAVQIQNELNEKLSTKAHLVDVSTKPITKIASMSGASSRADYYEAAAKGVDLFITGEQSDIYHEIKDYGCTVIFAGHHATEQTGVWALEKKVNEQFPDLETLFLDIPTNL